MDFKGYVGNLKNRLESIHDLFNLKELVVSFDTLKKKKKTDNELLYFKGDKGEKTGLFIFGNSFYMKELDEQDFKKVLSQNSLNLRIHNAYRRLTKKSKRVKVGDVLHEMHNKKKDSLEIHQSLKRVLTLSYYLNWKLEKDKKDIENDYYIEVPDKYLLSLKRRFNFDIVSPVYENKELFIFLNARSKLNLVFKEKDEFTKEDIEKQVLPILKKIFTIKKINLEK